MAHSRLTTAPMVLNDNDISQRLGFNDSQGVALHSLRSFRTQRMSLPDDAAAHVVFEP